MGSCTLNSCLHAATLIWSIYKVLKRASCLLLKNEINDGTTNRLRQSIYNQTLVTTGTLNKHEVT
eukprot:m.27632 g.27632  ORF g.27632 m.27632 type:complete len:65 (-) comp7913_c0_seq1:17-211(-)